MSVNVQLPGTGRPVTIATLEDYGGNRQAWGAYLYSTFGQGISRELDNLLVWQDGEGTYSDQALAKRLRLDLDFFLGIALRNVSGSVNLPVALDALIPDALDRPAPVPSYINPTTNVILSQLGPSMTPTQGSPGVPTGGNGQTMTKYRFFIESTTPYHRFDTGANIATCSRSNPNGCSPIQFRDPGGMAAMVKYAKDHGEVLVRVNSIDEAFAIMEGKTMPNPSQIVTGTTDSSVGLLALIPILGIAYNALKGR